ncbi:hypothetical protein A5664_27250 [Mycolicibacterium fortuitum]|uniref:hypothetical protein n=1 Tax=Mycolicibacterium fortuitum TaxID=1766 RepID=UPI0007EC3F2D|nr:hypothetical protein [Mycolicibacterium fortuitum]MCA4752936.1 hypothetical protein [Mycolicibacterium fortuitum]OBI74703.1 hypothetical protein A5664_27250 [Mycolicibacterium fortuitum]WAY17171.1 hypothetical protein OF855_17620 [Mycolicibacterium fortuitum]
MSENPPEPQLTGAQATGLWGLEAAETALITVVYGMTIRPEIISGPTLNASAFSALCGLFFTIIVYQREQILRLVYEGTRVAEEIATRWLAAVVATVIAAISASVQISVDNPWLPLAISAGHAALRGLILAASKCPTPTISAALDSSTRLSNLRVMWWRYRVRKGGERELKRRMRNALTYRDANR